MIHHSKRNLKLITKINIIRPRCQTGLRYEIICEDSNLVNEMNKEEILSQLRENVISCKDVTFTLLGFSLASINTIFSFLLSCIFIMLFRKYESN